MEEILNLLLGPLGTLVFSLVAVFGFYKRWIVPGWYARELEAEKNEWKEAALRGTRVAERAVTIHEAHEKRDINGSL